MPPLTAAQTAKMDYAKIPKIRPLDLAKCWQAEAIYHLLRRDCTISGVFACWGMEPRQAVRGRYPEWPEDVVHTGVDKLLELGYLEVDDSGDIEVVNYVETETARKNTSAKRGKAPAPKQQSFTDPKVRTPTADIDRVFEESNKGIDVYNKMTGKDLSHYSKKDRFARAEIGKAIKDHGLGKVAVAARNLVLSEWHRDRAMLNPRLACNSINRMIEYCREEDLSAFEKALALELKVDREKPTYKQV